MQSFTLLSHFKVYVSISVHAQGKVLNNYIPRYYQWLSLGGEIIGDFYFLLLIYLSFLPFFNAYV